MSGLGVTMAGAILAVGAVCVIEGVLLMGQARRLLTYADQLLGAATDLLAQVVGKSAPHTEAAADQEPHDHWERIRATGQEGPAPAAAEAPQPEQSPEQGPATAAAEPGHPTTAPMEAVVDAWHRDVTADAPSPDPTDAALARFTFSPAGRRAAGTTTEHDHAGGDD